MLRSTISSALQGKEISENVIGYLGIPYAKPPLKDRRFKFMCLAHECDPLRQSDLTNGVNIPLPQRANLTIFAFNVEHTPIQDSEAVLHDETGSYTTWPAGCPGMSTDGKAEDCLYLSLLQAKNTAKKTNTLLIFSNEKLSEKKLTELVSPSLNVAVAGVRTGVLGSLGNASYGVSDVISAVKLLKDNADVLNIGEVTVWAESFEAEAVASALSMAEYPNDSSFDENYTYTDFKRALAGLLPDSLYRNAPLLRKLVLHQYVYTQGDKKNTYLLFEQMRKALLDRDFIAPTQKLVEELKSNKAAVYLFEFGIDNPPKSCLEDGGWEDIKPFCDKMFQYFTRFAVKGQPTKNSCEPTNPTWPAMGSSKRDYHVILKLPALDQLELKGRRDAIFKEETQLLPTELEDDEQDWHRRAANIGGFDFSEDDALNDLPFHAEL
ncbi:hypothetical protein ANCCEY_01144 [Ancylostoma ceylanicum]|uniref:Uncharacterized protein n=1 Tax=Ancylostoma ceylanicum TaxID=53326 RepID=A0A0D6M6Q0_9BILA|nr:hypothetical protein ANCCEY_01144 [Ancylostoma ceylanicum]